MHLSEVWNLEQSLEQTFPGEATNGCTFAFEPDMEGCDLVHACE